MNDCEVKNIHMKAKQHFDNKILIFDRPIWYNRYFYKKYIKLIIEDLYLKFLFWRHPMIITPKKYKLSICGIFKNEAPYMKEWIEYHLLQGFEHFYLYNNNSDDNYQEILEPYIKKGIVTFMDWPKVPGQTDAYIYWYEHYRHETNWVAFLDFDEFFCPRYENSTVAWLDKHSKYPLILIYWRFFCTSGVLEHDDKKLVIEQYDKCYDRLINVGKLLYNTDYDIEQFYLGFWHVCSVKYKNHVIPPINSFGYFVKYDIHRYGNGAHDIQLNHYWSRSYNSYLAKHKRGSACQDGGKSWKTFSKLREFELRNNSSDHIINRFILETKLKVLGLYPKEQNK